MMIRPSTVEELLRARAAAMAAQDGAQPGAVHIVGAAHQLQAELISARDKLLCGRQAPPAALPPEPVAAPIAAIEPVAAIEPDQAPAAAAADEEEAS